MFLISSLRASPPEQHEEINNVLERKITISGENLELLDILNDLGVTEYVDYKITKPIIITNLNFSGTFLEFLTKMEDPGVCFYEIKSNKLILRSPSQRYLKIYQGAIGKKSLSKLLEQITKGDKGSFYSYDKDLGLCSLFTTGKEHSMLNRILKAQKNNELQFFEVEIVFLTVFDSNANGGMNFDGLIENIQNMFLFGNFVGGLCTVAMDMFTKYIGKRENINIVAGGSQTLIVKNGQQSTISDEICNNSNGHLDIIAKNFKNLKTLPRFLINNQKDSGVKTQSTIKVSSYGDNKAAVNINFSTNTPGVQEKVNTSAMVTFNKPKVISVTSGNLGRRSKSPSFLASIFGKSGTQALHSSTFVILLVRKKS
jgi:hypothetical protein